MALDIMADQRALHTTSRTITTAIKDSRPDAARALWEIPHYATATPTRPGPAIPPPSIFESLEQFTIDDYDAKSHLPSIAECAVHLEFLEALYVLRQQVLKSEALDEVFDIKPEYKFVDRKGVRTQLKDEMMWERRQVKWGKFVEIAVVRFMAWWGKVRNADQTMPSLDVLMVWHSFLLNTRYYRINNRSKPVLYQLSFPWANIHRAINPDDWTFSLTKTESTAFQVATGLQPDLFKSLSEWKEYSPETRSLLIGATRFSLQQSELSPSITSSVKPHEQRLLQRFVDVVNEAGSRELKEAILRQVSFVDKMNEQLWIRSPALDGTLRRARDRYNNFLHLYKLYPTTMFVPTLDIDLVWHTHQCSPSQYFENTQELAGKFVNHNDTIVKDKLSTGLSKTKDLYRIRFGQEYLVCGCWDCEALLSALESSEQSGEDPDLESVAKQVSSDVAYHRAVEVARRKNQPLPVR